jgi:uncharacterized protein (UPF0262 family)
MSKKHILTIFLIDGSKENYTFICESNIDAIRSSLMKEVADEGVFSLMTEDNRLLVYPLGSILKLSVSNVEEWKEGNTQYITVTAKRN